MSRETIWPKVSQYKVEEGDSLWMIASHQYGNPIVWPEISKANHLPNPGLILVGMQLKLPPAHVIITKHRSNQLVRPRDTPAPRGGAYLPQQLGREVTGPVRLQQSIGTASTVQTPIESGNRRALQVKFPAVKYKLDDFPSIPVSTPVADFVLRFIGEISVQQKGTMSEVELSQRGTLSEKLKAEYKSKVADLAGQVKIGFNAQTRQVQVSCGFSVAAKLDGQVFAISQYDFIPPNRLKYSYKPAPIKGEWEGLVFSGSVGFELEVVIKKPDSPPPAEPLTTTQPVVVTGPQPVPVWMWVTAGGLAVTGAAIIVADIVKDVGTLGAGLVESPLSFAAASALFAQAANMVK